MKLCRRLLLFFLFIGMGSAWAEEKEKEGKKRPKFDVPIPEGREAKVLTIPMYDEKGKLQMNFKIGIAKRIDNEHLEMSDLKIQTYGEQGEEDMMIDLQRSVMDLNTRIISSDQSTVIRRSDFELTGDAVEFDTQNKRGKLLGKVKMLIHDKSELSAEGNTK